MLTTRQLANVLSGIDNEDEVYRRLLLFLVDYQEGYGVNDGPRGNARVMANRGGYFWLPCVLCGNWHGGQEASRSYVMITEHSSLDVCPNCNVEAKEVNKLFPNGIGESQ